MRKSYREQLVTAAAPSLLLTAERVDEANNNDGRCIESRLGSIHLHYAAVEKPCGLISWERERG